MREVELWFKSFIKQLLKRMHVRNSRKSAPHIDTPDAAADIITTLLECDHTHCLLSTVYCPVLCTTVLFGNYLVHESIIIHYGIISNFIH